jgi:hypothetical protein
MWHVWEEEKYMQGFGGETWKKETYGKLYAEMRELH